jgi:hypothetical protein
MDVDLYLLLRQYAQKNSTWEIPFTGFVESVQRMAKAYVGKSAEIAAYAERAEPKVVAQLHNLVGEKRVALIESESRIHQILLPDRFIEPIKAEYRKMQESAEVPFPEEEALKLSIPPEWVQGISLETDLPAVLMREELPAVPLCRITFPSSSKPIIVLTEQIKAGLLEFAVVKLRAYLRKGSNYEFTRRKLLAAFQNKEMILKDAFNLVLTRPYDAVEQMRMSKSDMTFSFWAYLVSHVRQDLMKRGERTPEDLSYLQALSIAEFFNNFYKGQAQKAMELEAAFKVFDLAVRRSPYIYQYQDLTAFADQGGRPLMGRYSKEEFDEYLAAKVKAKDYTRLPEIVSYQTAQARRYYTAKDRLLTLSMKLLSEAREAIRGQLMGEWYKAMGNFESLPEMFEDEAYVRDLNARLEKTSPVLSVLIKEKFILLAYVEFRGTKEALPELDKLFEKGELAPIDQLLALPRKGLLTDVRILLPFWYSIGLVVSLMRLFKSMRKKKGTAATTRSSSSPEAQAVEAAKGASGQDRQRELREAAVRVEKAVVPQGMGLDDWLVELESKWNTLLNPQAKRDLTEDVNSLVRDYLRGVLRTLRGSTFTDERVAQLAETLAGSQSLIKIRNAQALKSYIVGYIVRLVKKAS